MIWNCGLAIGGKLEAQKDLGPKRLEEVLQLSPGREERSELMLCVATIGMHLACRERLKNFSRLSDPPVVRRGAGLSLDALTPGARVLREKGM
jgi:hypothetical protein